MTPGKPESGHSKNQERACGEQKHKFFPVAHFKVYVSGPGSGQRDRIKGKTVLRQERVHVQEMDHRNALVQEPRDQPLSFFRLPVPEKRWP